jgi:ankyrin repeat protein
MTRITSFCVLCLLAGVALAHAATSDVADAAMQGNREAVRAAIARKADVNVPQIDGTTALHWAAERDDLDMADLLIRAGARLTVKTREGVTPLQLAAINGSAAMLDRLLKAGADANAPLTAAGDTAVMMAARTG